MSDRSEEVTESRDTEDLLAETEELLSGTGGGVNTDEPRAPAESEPRRSVETDSRPSSTQLGSPAESDTKSGPSRLSRLKSTLSIPTSGPSLEQYFSPRAFFAFVLLVGTGLVAGGMTIPFAGRIIGMFGVAFAVGLLTSRRRYLEMAAAGTTVGGLSALASYTVLAVAGSYQAVVAVGVAAGLVGCLIGYYFGRDLRNGLVRDID